MTKPLTELSEAGVSIWLDDLSRERIETGNLAELIETHHVVGVTTNPTIFASALAKGEKYAAQIAELKSQGVDLDKAVFELTTTDVQSACDILLPVYESTGGKDGRVSIEVEPGLARKTDETVATAEKLWARVNRPNAMIKIPATQEGLPAIAATIAKGISVNVTLIFSLERYRAVMDAYLYGLEQAAAEGRDLSSIFSVASFFVSRVDSEVDSRLPADSELKGKAAIANAQLAYQVCEEVFSTDRAQALLSAGANLQRPLWASTGVKDPSYSDTMYVSELVAPDTVNTMPEKTLDAFADHGVVTSGTVTSNYESARKIIDEIEAHGISFDEVVEQLEIEGLQKFDDSWAELLETVEAELSKA